MTLSRYSRAGILALSALFLLQVAASLVLQKGYLLTVVTDLIQGVLLAAATIAFLWAASRSHARTRLFCTLCATGSAFWLLYQLLWIYLEVFERREVPDPFAGDIVLFLHIVPMIAAVALQPHREHSGRSARVAGLDFALFLTWWFFLYCFAVIPWQYIHASVDGYDHDFNLLYMTEKMVLIVVLAYSCWRSRGWWRIVYGHLLGASALYAASSYAANWAIFRGIYFSGSIFDTPLAASMVWTAAAGLVAADLCPHAEPQHHVARQRSWTAQLGMATIFTLPLFASYAALDLEVPSEVRTFRLSVSLLGMLVMGGLVFLKQHLLDRELLGLVHTSNEALEDLKRVQDQIVQSEKMASMAHLVGGAAHELNNPLTAMLGYSDLLASSTLEPAQRELAQKVGEQARRTKNLVDNLISIAKHSPGEKSSVQLNTLIQTALRLSKQQLQDQNIEVGISLASNLPPVRGDTNQLLQVFLHLIKNASAGEKKHKHLYVSSLRKDDTVCIEFIELHGPAGASRGADSRLIDPKAGVGLGACYGIIANHNGKITSEIHPESRTIVRIEMPALPSPANAPKTASTAVAMRNVPESR